MTVVPIMPLIRTKVMPISGAIGRTILRIANATSIGYRHDQRMKYSNKHTCSKKKLCIKLLICHQIN